jgi:hypothetical protein
MRKQYEAEQAEGDLAVANFVEYIGINTLVCIFVAWIVGGTVFYYHEGFLAPFGRHNLAAAAYFMINAGLSVGAGPCEPGACTTHPVSFTTHAFSAFSACADRCGVLMRREET